VIVEPRTRTVGRGEVRRVLPYRARRMVGPFVFADVMGPDELVPTEAVDIDAHPHIGLCTVTYLFSGSLEHRDSTGAVARIEPGAVNWMTAGRGVCHTERSPAEERERRRELWGVQTWVALPTDSEEVPPAFAHHPADGIPTDSRSGVDIRVAVGRAWGLESPVEVLSPTLLAEVELDGAELTLPRDRPELAVLAVGGEVSVGGTALAEAHLAVLDAPSAVSVAGTGRVMVLGGDPVGDRHIWWNFVSSSPERIEAAKQDWSAQRFPLVPGDHDPWVPLPT